MLQYFLINILYGGGGGGCNAGIDEVSEDSSVVPVDNIFANFIPLLLM